MENWSDEELDAIENSLLDEGYTSAEDYYSRFDPKWESTLDWITRLPEVGECCE